MDKKDLVLQEKNADGKNVKSKIFSVENTNSQKVKNEPNVIQNKNIEINDINLTKLPTGKRAKSKERDIVNQSNSSVMQSVRLNDAGKVVASIKRTQIDSYDELESYKLLLKKKRKKLVARIFTFLFLLIIAPILIFFTSIIIDRDGKHSFFGVNFYIVATNSMEPEIMVNDFVVLKKVDDVDSLKIGDDIGYINEKGQVIIHRIIDIKEESQGEEIYKKFVTKGINNDYSDQLMVEYEDIVGIRTKTLHMLGDVIMFFRSPWGIAVMVLILIGVIAGFSIAFRMSELITHVSQVDGKN